MAAAPRRNASRSSKVAPRPDRTLYVALEWIEAHCVVPDGWRRGQPFELYRDQGTYLAHFYLVRGDADWIPDNPIKGSAFVNKRALYIGPQKVGKNPLIAAQCALEGIGPALFAGFAGHDEGYVCAEHGCRCGWEYPYDYGEPRGMAWPTPLIQITAYSEDSTGNTYEALRPMIELGPLDDLIPKTGEEFIRLPGGGKIDTVTSSDRSRLGQRITFAPQDEVGLWTRANRMTSLADTQWRNLSGMGGRASLTSNAYDPGEHSVAQQIVEDAEPDIWVQMRVPPANLSYGDKRERHKIHLAVYPDDVRRENGGHLELASIESEAASLMLRDPAQAERFYGNRIVSGGGKAFDSVAWGNNADAAHKVPPRAGITLGFDGSKVDDTTALIATEIATGFQWPLGIWDPRKHHGQIPEELVDAAVDEAFSDYRVWRMYADPPYWKEKIAEWQGRYGDKVVLLWETGRPKAMAYAVANYATAISDGSVTHNGDVTFATHIGHAFSKPTFVKNDKGEPMYAIQKESKESGNKIDAASAGVLSWEARTDAVAAGMAKAKRPSRYNE